MYRIILIIVITLTRLLIPGHAQSSLNGEIQSALIEFEEGRINGDFEMSITAFERIIEAHPNEWLPVYFHLWARTLRAHTLTPEEALKEAENLDAEYEEFEKLNPDKSEAITLRGMINTIKVAKFPMRYGMTLSQNIIWDYRSALLENPNNPRPMYLSAQFQIISASYIGDDPKQYCAQIEKAVLLFEKEDKTNNLIHWGEEKAVEILNTDCK